MANGKQQTANGECQTAFSELAFPQAELHLIEREEPFIFHAKDLSFNFANLQSNPMDRTECHS